MEQILKTDLAVNPDSVRKDTPIKLGRDYKEELKNVQPFPYLGCYLNSRRFK